MTQPRHPAKMGGVRDPFLFEDYPMTNQPAPANNTRKFPSIYKKDTKGKARVWWVELDEPAASYRVHSGLLDGKQTVSSWKTVKGKNIGRANETTPLAQASLQIHALYKKKLRVDYHESLSTIDQEKIFKPMKADSYSEREEKFWADNDLVYWQPKVDGIRCVINRQGMWTQDGREIISCPHILEELSAHFLLAPEVEYFDGELYNHGLKDDFNKIVSLVKRDKPTEETLAQTKELVEYHIFDIVGFDRTWDFTARNLYLDNIADNFLNEGCLVQVETVKVTQPYQANVIHQMALEEGYEGSMYRAAATPYENKRTKNLLKRKDFIDGEFTITRIEEGTGNWKGYAKVVYFENPLTGGESKATLKGTQAYTKEVYESREDYVGKQVTVTHFGTTKDNEYRFPIAKALHLTERF